MSTTRHTEYLKLQSVYINPARHAFGSTEKIMREWQELNYLDQPDFEQALTEYSVFESCLKNQDVGIRHFPHDPTVSIDAIYCRDASIATDFGMIMCRMGKTGRVNEPRFHQHSYDGTAEPVLGRIEAPGTIEGGDVAWLDKTTLAVGYSYRTNETGIAQLKALLEPHGIEIIVVELPHFRGPQDVFHLMSILSPVDKDLAVVYSSLMPITFRNELLKRGFKLVEVPESEFDSMGCNVLAVAPRTCIMVDGNPITKSRLEEAGCDVITYKGDEISVKGGGGPTCLTRPLDREF